jgi:DNA-binding IclR family transcriptional regulator
LTAIVRRRMIDPVGQARGEGGRSVADRVSVVLEHCATSSHPLSLAELATRTGLPKTTLHRVCWKLEELGLLNHSDGGFEVATRLFALGSMNPRLRRLRAIAMPYLHTLVAESGWVVNLAVLSDHRALIVEELSGGQMARVARMGGVSMPLHATAIGKALLSGMPDDELDELLGEASLRPFTGRTVVRPKILREQLAVVRARRVAFSHEEWRMGTSGVASPVTSNGQVVAALALVGISDEAGLRRLAHPVRRAADAVGVALDARSAGHGVPYAERRR